MALRSRAARVPPDPRPAAGRRHVVFTLAGVEYAIDARQVRRSMPAASPLGPDVLFLGQAYPVLDLRAPFGHATSGAPGRLVLLVEGTRRRAALVVDTLVDLLLVEEGTMAPPPALFGGPERRWLVGLVRLGGRLVVVVQLDALLDADADPSPADARRAATAG